MATQTPNYRLIKPDYADPVDVGVLNTNADLIDSALTEKANLVGGKVPASELPSYVDDVIEGYYYNGAFYEDSAHTTPLTGETGKIYVDLSSNISYRWSGSAYVSLSKVDDVRDHNGNSLVVGGIATLPEIPEPVQPDWNQTDTTADDYIKNKPSGKWTLIAQKTLTEAAQYIDFTLDEGITDFILLAKIHKPSSATNMLLWIGTSLDDEQQISQRALGTAATSLEIIDVNLLPEVACEARGIHHNTIDQGGVTAMTAYANCNTIAANLPAAITWIDCHFSQAVNAGTQISIFAKS